MDKAFIEQRNELIMRAWAAGMETSRICSGLDVTRNTVLGVVHRARQDGDERAVSRAVGGGRKPSAAIAERNSRVLDDWSVGRDVRRIADEYGLTEANVRLVVFSARRAGDPRASLRMGGRKKPDGPAANGRREYFRIRAQRKASERLARAYAYADGSAWS
jgi:hypothetical protein